MATPTKPAIKSLGVWGSTSALISFIYSLVGTLSELPPELFDDTKATWALVLGTVSAVAALIGRWKAHLPIKGIVR